MKASNQRVMAALLELGMPSEIKLLDRDVRTSEQAAAALGCSVGQIAKSLIFRLGCGDAVLAVTSGANRVDLRRLGEIANDEILKADADFVRSKTGFAIGGVAPVGLASEVMTCFDQDLFGHDQVWAAAGTPDSLFPILREDLLRLAKGRIYGFAQ